MNERYILLVFICGTLIFILFSLYLILFFIHHKRKQQLHITEKMNLEHQYQSQLLQTQLEVQEQAFKYLSEEIHDNVGQALSMVKLQLYAIGREALNPAQNDLIDTTKEVLSKAISDLRNISHNLHGGYVSKNGLYEAIEKEVNYVNGSRSVNAGLTTSGTVYSLNAEKELLIFRIVQEAVNNALKHANADTIEVCLNYLPETFNVMIKDDGEGFDPNLSLQSKGLGLSNMKNRAALLDGELYIESIIPKGTIIILTVKTKTNEQSEDKNSAG